MKKVREGYKKTLAGEIPEDWWYEELNKLVDKITDGTHKTPTYTESGIPFLRVTDIQKSEIDWSNVKYISQQEHLELIKRCNPEIGDILYSKNGTIGIPKIIDWDNEFSIFVSLCLIKMKKQNSYISNKYLEQFLKSDSCMRQIRLRAKQGTVTNLHLEEIRELIIPIPTIKEQEKIASILSTVDEQIDNVDALIEKNKELKKGLMQTLLTKGIGHTKFKKTEIGEIPEEWEVKQLGDIANYINGKAFKPSEWGTEGLPIVRIQNLNGANEYNYYSGIIDDKFIINNGQLLFAWSGSKGTSFGPFIWNSGKAVLNQHIFKVDLNGFVNSIYGYYALKQVTQIIEESAHGSAGLVHVTKGTLEKFKIGIPKVEEQIKIASILSEIDGKIGEHENKKQKLGELKRGLMQQLLTGKIRVI